MTEYRRAGLEITLANPFGPPVRGWKEVADRLDLAASHHRDYTDYEFENIVTSSRTAIGR
jgi:hypothetical protein